MPQKLFGASKQMKEQTESVSEPIVEHSVHVITYETGVPTKRDLDLALDLYEIDLTAEFDN